MQYVSQAPYVAAVVQHGPDGRERIQKCRTMAEAMNTAETWCIKAENHGLAVAQSQTPAELAMVAEVKNELAAAGLTLADMVKLTRERLARSHRKMTVAEATAEVIAERESRGMSARYIQGLRHMFNRLTEGFAGRDVADVTTNELRQWIDSLPWSRGSKNSLRRHAMLVWKHANRSGACQGNPAADITPWKVAKQPVAIHTLAQVRALLDHAPPDFVSVLAIALFSGLRREERIRIDWKDIQLHHKVIVVPPHVAKNGQRRDIPISENLADWLAPHHRASGKLIGSEATFRRRFDASRAAAGIDGAADNELRHSYASYHYALTADAERTAKYLGHPDTKLLHSNYNHVVRESEGEAYFNIRPAPATASNILPINTRS